MKIIDQIVKYFSQETITDKPQETEISYDNSVCYTSRDFQKYNPDDLLWKKGLDVYDRMLLDDQVKAVIEFKIHAVSCRGYTFEASDDPLQQKMALFFQKVIDDIQGSFTDKLQLILTALKYGFSISEIIFNAIEFENKQYWGIKDIKTRPTKTFYDGFKIDKHGNIISLKQEIETGEKAVIPMDKIIHFVHQPWVDAHYGQSDLRAAYRNYWSKDIIIKFQNIFLERFAGGFVTAKVTGDLGTTQKANLKNVIKNISARLGIIIPSTVDLDVTQPQHTEAYEKAIAQHDKAIAKSTLVPNLLGLTEQGGTGSYAQAKVHLDAFFMVTDALCKRLEECWNEQVSRKLALFNFGVTEYPRLKFDSISKDQKFELAKTYMELTKYNTIHKGESDEIYIRKILGLPEMPEDIEDEEPPVDNIPDNGEEQLQPNKQEEIEEIEKFIDRKLNPWELRVNIKQYKESWDNADNNFSDSLNAVMGLVKQSLYANITKIIGDRPLRTISLKDFSEIKIPAKLVKQLKVIIGDNLQGALVNSYNLAYKELPKKYTEKIKDKVIKPGKDIGRADKFLKDKKFWITDVIEKFVLDAAQLILANSIKYDKNLKQTLLALNESPGLIAYLPEIDGAGRVVNKAARLENIVRTNTSEAINLGRQSVFNHPDIQGFIQAYQYSAILDDRVSDICESLDGRIQKDWGSYTPPNHYQCRSILIPITTVDDWNGKTDNIPSSVKPLKGFG